MTEMRVEDAPLRIDQKVLPECVRKKAAAGTSGSVSWESSATSLQARVEAAGVEDAARIERRLHAAGDARAAARLPAAPRRTATRSGSGARSRVQVPRAARAARSTAAMRRGVGGAGEPDQAAAPVEEAAGARPRRRRAARRDRPRGAPRRARPRPFAAAGSGRRVAHRRARPRARRRRRGSRRRRMTPARRAAARCDRRPRGRNPRSAAARPRAPNRRQCRHQRGRLRRQPGGGGDAVGRAQRRPTAPPTPARRPARTAPACRSPPARAAPSA